ncbi:MAG: DUF892 family protein [Opitutaceae bacterium]
MVEELKDLYSAENQLVKALPKMAKAARSEELQQAFETHLQQTEVHVQRLETIGKQLGEGATDKLLTEIAMEFNLEAASTAEEQE